ncbi:MAG: homocysteine S-methyltransferase [Chloroflexi bacterium]|jgi:homocysteine S-methyltransferase|nr:MAG: homocysteine S-methyltransferase [Chloroflexota bacterium]
MILARVLQDKLDAKRMVIMDGATGTEVARRGVTIDPKLSWSAKANITSPDLVRDIHRDYILAGAEIITANTFSTSRATLATDGLSEQTEEINKQSVALAIEARKNCEAEKTVVIAGSMSSFEPKGNPEINPLYEEALEDYREQVEILAGAGVDLIILEMFVRTVDLRAAVEAATETNLPIWVGLSCERHNDQIYMGLLGRHGGETIADAVAAAASPNVKAFCIMHSPPEVTADALRELKAYTSLPIGAYAHGGSIEAEIGKAPKISKVGQFLSDTDPEKYLDYAREWAACGATIIGGCCGTTPEHIRALVDSNIIDTRG